MALRLLFLTSVFMFSTGAFATWKQSNITDKRQLSSLCGGEGKFSVTEDEFAMADVYKNKLATFIACHTKDEKPDYLTMEYILKYDLGAKPEALHMDAAMMAWGAEVMALGEVLTANFYWPSDRKLRRKVREFQIDCTGRCQLKEACAIGRLKGDLEIDHLIKNIEAQTKTPKMRARFAADGSQSDSILLDQLFAEALSGNKKALALISKLDDGGGNSAASEIIGTYQLFLTDLKSKGCHWVK